MSTLALSPTAVNIVDNRYRKTKLATNTLGALREHERDASRPVMITWFGTIPVLYISTSYITSGFFRGSGFC
jgi:hypothetical protein